MATKARALERAAYVSEKTGLPCVAELICVCLKRERDASERESSPQNPS